MNYSNNNNNNNINSATTWKAFEILAYLILMILYGCVCVLPVHCQWVLCEKAGCKIKTASIAVFARLDPLFNVYVHCAEQPSIYACKPWMSVFIAYEIFPIQHFCVVPPLYVSLQSIHDAFANKFSAYFFLFACCCQTVCVKIAPCVWTLMERVLTMLTIFPFLTCIFQFYV